MTVNIIGDGDEFYLGYKDKYLPENIGSNKKEVIKFIPPEQRNDPDVKRMNKIESQIINGLENPLSGTGTPIANLSGGAKENAQRANIGGGSKANGGGGMMQGTKNLMEAAYIKGKIDERYKKDSTKKLEE